MSAWVVHESQHGMCMKVSIVVHMYDGASLYMFAMCPLASWYSHDVPAGTYFLLSGLV